MTIKEFSESVNRTPQAVYKRLKDKGIDVDSLKQEKSTELTDEGLQLLSQIFGYYDKSQDSVKVDCLAGENNELKEFINKLNSELEKMRGELAEIRLDRDKWQDIAQKSLSALGQAQTATQQAQALQLQTLQLLPSKTHTSIWARLLGRKNDS